LENNVFLVDSMKACGRISGMISIISNLGAGCKCSV